jgi:hypothetical protein
MNIEILAKKNETHDMCEDCQVCVFCDERGHSEYQCLKMGLSQRICSVYGIDSCNSGYPPYFTERDYTDEEKKIIKSNKKLVDFKNIVQKIKGTIDARNIEALKKFNWEDSDIERLFPFVKKIKEITENTDIETIRKIFNDVSMIQETKMDKAYIEKNLCHLYDQETEKYYTCSHLPCSWCGTNINVRFLKNIAVGSRYCGCADSPLSKE